MVSFIWIKWVRSHSRVGKRSAAIFMAMAMAPALVTALDVDIGECRVSVPEDFVLYLEARNHIFHSPDGGSIAFLPTMDAGPRGPNRKTSHETIGGLVLEGYSRVSGGVQFDTAAIYGRHATVMISLADPLASARRIAQDCIESKPQSLNDQP